MAANLVFFKLFIAYGQPLQSLVEASGLRAPGRFASVLPRAAHFPLSLSFLTLQAISMLVMLPAKTLPRVRGCCLFPAYILMFPKAISGPIVRFQEMTAQVKERSYSIPQAASGLRRFMLGFAKKVLIAVLAAEHRYARSQPMQLASRRPCLAGDPRYHVARSILIFLPY